jgi:DNA modification methylase
MGSTIILKKEIGRLNIQLGQTQIYVAELEEKIDEFTKQREIKEDVRKYDDISNKKLSGEI